MAREADKIKKHQQQIIKEIGNMVTIMGVEAKNHYVKSFRDGGFTDESLVMWEKRKNDKDPTRAVLVGKRNTGSQHLKHSIVARRSGQFSVTISTDVKYAKIHNDGEVVSRRARSGTIHLREFSTNIQTGVISRRFASQKRGRKYLRATSSMNVQIGAYSFKMTKRQFIGASRQLSIRLYNKFDKRIQSIFK